MTPRHHLPEEVLLDYATGTTPEAVALVAATHLTFCGRCRAEVARLETLAGALLESAPTAPVNGGSFDAILQHLDGSTGDRDVDHENEAATASHATAARAGIPRPIARYVEHPARWRFVMPGIRQMRVSLSLNQRRVRLLRLAPRAALPMHSHRGIEFTQIISGVMVDGGVEYCAGDVEVRDATIEHDQPRVGAEPCVCLIVGDARLVPGTVFGRIMQWITDW